MSATVQVSIDADAAVVDYRVSPDGVAFLTIRHAGIRCVVSGSPERVRGIADRIASETSQAREAA